MKTKTSAMIAVLLFCCCVTACTEAKRPIDQPESAWKCEVASIYFEVSEDCKITNATMLDNNGNTVSISLVFSDVNEAKVSITNPEETETYISGTCTFEKNSFTVLLTDIYNSSLSIPARKLTFKKTA